MCESILTSIGRIAKICGLSGLICVILGSALEVAQRIWQESQQSQMASDDSLLWDVWLYSYSVPIYRGIVAIGAVLIAVAVAAKVVDSSIEDPKDKEEVLY